LIKLNQNQSKSRLARPKNAFKNKTAATTIRLSHNNRASSNMLEKLVLQQQKVKQTIKNHQITSATCQKLPMTYGRSQQSHYGC
jgi:hypothetical protein